jgi:hypothetical protein
MGIDEESYSFFFLLFKGAKAIIVFPCFDPSAPIAPERV